MHALVGLLLCINQHTKLVVHSFADFKGMIKGQNLNKGLRHPDHAH